MNLEYHFKKSDLISNKFREEPDYLSSIDKKDDAQSFSVFINISKFWNCGLASRPKLIYSF